MRSAFRKEHKKVLKLQMSGAGAEEMYAPRSWYNSQLLLLLLLLCDQQAPHSSTSSMQEEEETTTIAAQHNSSLTADIMEMICTHLNYTLNWSVFFRFNCTCVLKPLAGQTEQSWHSLACAVKTEGKTVRVWGPLTFMNRASGPFRHWPEYPSQK